MKKKLIRFTIKCTLCLIFLPICFSVIYGQTDPPARGGLTSEDFGKAVKVSSEIVRQRRKPVKSTASATVKAKTYLPRRKTQRISLRVKTNNPSKPTAKPTKPAANTGWEEIGFTVWKLRRKSPKEETATVSVVENGVRVEYVPERMESDTPLKLGDKVRLTIESPRNGYLYVVDTEFYTDGSFGNPTLIFPTQRTRGGNNRVSAGVLIDIPAQDDDVPFFVINSKNPIYAGELLSVIISNEIVSSVSTPPKARSLESNLFDEWKENWELEADVFEQDGGNGTSWTNAEKEAGQVNGRSLTQEDPTPQTIYRVRADKQKPILVNLALPVSRQ